MTRTAVVAIDGKTPCHTAGSTAAASTASTAAASSSLTLFCTGRGVATLVKTLINTVNVVLLLRGRASRSDTATDINPLRGTHPPGRASGRRPLARGAGFYETPFRRKPWDTHFTILLSLLRFAP
jgi:hypothetical protein